MERNLKAVSMALLLSAFVDGLFNFVTPFYLTSVGISLFEIGIIFSAATLVMVLISIVLGAYTDIQGRKVIFAFSFLLQSISNAIFPSIRSVLNAVPTKILHEVGSSIRISLRSTIIFENARETYQKIISWITGAQHLTIAFVSIGAASILSFLSFSGSYYLMAILQSISFLVVLLAYHEKAKAQKSSRVSMRNLYGLDLKRNMWILMIASMLNTVGFMLSHGFAEPLYWEAKYALSKSQVGLIMGLHKLSLGLPLFFTGTIMHKLNVKRAYIFSTLLLAGSLAVMGFISNIFIAIPIWLLHDTFGGSIQVPSGEMLTQLNARDDKRGKDTNTMLLLTRIFSIITPSFAGSLITINWDLIFIVGGFLILIAALVMYFFYKE